MPWRSAGSAITCFIHPPTDRPGGLVRRLRPAADDQRLRGHSVRGLRGDGDGAAGRRAGAARATCELMGDERGADRAARRRRRPTRGAGAAGPRRRASGAAPGKPARARAESSSPSPDGGGPRAALRRDLLAGRRRTARPRSAGRPGRRPSRLRDRPRPGHPLVSLHRPVLQPRALPSRVPRVAPRADLSGARDRSSSTTRRPTPGPSSAWPTLERRDGVTLIRMQPTAGRAPPATRGSSAATAATCCPWTPTTCSCPTRWSGSWPISRRRRRAGWVRIPERPVLRQPPGLLRGAGYNLHTLTARQLLRHLLAARPSGVRCGTALSPRTSSSATRTGTSSSCSPSGESGASRAHFPTLLLPQERLHPVRLGGVRRRGLSRGHPGSPSLALRARGADKGPLVAGPVAHTFFFFFFFFFFFLQGRADGLADRLRGASDGGRDRRAPRPLARGAGGGRARRRRALRGGSTRTR